MEKRTTDIKTIMAGPQLAATARPAVAMVSLAIVAHMMLAGAQAGADWPSVRWHKCNAIIMAGKPLSMFVVSVP